MALYRNRETGKTQFHPKSGLGETFNADEIDETGKSVNAPAKPRVKLGSTKGKVREARRLQKDNSKTPSTQTTAADSGSGDSEQEGAQ